MDFSQLQGGRGDFEPAPTQNPPVVPLFQIFQRGKFEEEKVQLFTVSTGESLSFEFESPSLEKRG
jgi:hypothetical protein